MRYREALAEGTKVLEAAGIDTAELDAWYLLENICHITRQYYYLNDGERLKEEEIQEYQLVIQKRAEHVPLQYITGEQEFMGMTFKVNPSVLIPRQDTEILVEEILKLCGSRDRVLDLCTGSGCIIISMVRNLPDIEAYGGDISRKAINVAKENAKLNQTAVLFERSDLFDAFSGKFNVIVSNPPYIPSIEIPKLMPEVRDFEPHEALDGKEDGLFFYRKIVAGSVEYLEEDGILCMEIGYNQGVAVSRIMRKFGFLDVTVVKDLAGHDRVIRGHL
ncbi:MAG: peptide chain release factor N(5)-glutamine methyltransferase [Lachnospiraceae bacterium]|nr:peptide chain release factor N(5)-glutamine methyltransferase [Lachnospiraceae bacterium]